MQPNQTPEALIRMARDWQAIATREAAEFLGTPEGAARLVEAKRYGLLADALATQRQAEPAEDDGDYYSEEADDIEQSRARADARDAQRYRSFFSAGLPITFLGVDYRTKEELDAAIDAAIQKDTQ